MHSTESFAVLHFDHAAASIIVCSAGAGAVRWLVVSVGLGIGPLLTDTTLTYSLKMAPQFGLGKSPALCAFDISVPKHADVHCCWFMPTQPGSKHHLEQRDVNANE